MRIGIDARLILYQRRGGAQYIFNLLRSLLKIDQDNEYILLYSFFRGAKKELINELIQPNVKNRVYRIPNRILSLLWNKFHFPSIDLMMGKMDLFHIPYCHQIPPISTKLVVTIHDLIPLRFPQHYSKKELSTYKKMLEMISKKASLIITDSDNSKNDILEMTDIKEESLKVIPIAAGEEFRPIRDRKRLLQVIAKYGIKKEYILFVGGASANKNLSRLVEAFKIFKKNTPYKQQLILVGKRSWGYDKVIQHVKKLGLEEEVIFTDYIPNEDLVHIYNGADLFIFPSLYEGFGLSPLEAMACGTPVVASNTSSIPEVVQDSGILIDPYNTGEMAQAMARVLDNASLHQELSKKGLEKAKLFSWERCAKETLKVYQEAVENE